MRHTLGAEVLHGDNAGWLLPRRGEDKVGEIPPYGDDAPWEDDWDWDWAEEPQVTYRDAIEWLHSLLRGRTDVRIDWNGQRGLPRDDARVVFTGATGAGELRVRFRSATQLEEFTRIISSTTLLADRHAVWYPSEQVITARLVGDYDQFHAVVARTLAPRLNNRRFVLDSTLGRDVARVLASGGTFHVTEPAGPPGPISRSIHLVSANQDLRLLYGPHGREVPSVAIQLTGFTVPDAAQAEKALVEYGTAYLYNLGKAVGASLRLWRSEYRLGSQRRQTYSGKVRFPQHCYDAHPTELYAVGNSASRDPVERYLKYYQVLEFYMTKAADSVAASQGVAVDRAVSPLPRSSKANRLSSEQNKLDAVISLAVMSAQIMHLLNDKELFATLSDPQVIQDVQALSADRSRQPIAGNDYRQEISTRVYDLRNRIVHMKEGGGRKGRLLLAPYSREARDLTADLRLARFLSAHAIEHWSTPLP